MSVLAALAVVIPAGAAQGHGRVGHDISTAELRAFEMEVLGPEHASQHIDQRRDERRELRRWHALSPEERMEVQRRERRDSLNLARATAASAPASQIGRWTRPPFHLPQYAIHSVMLPTGKVLFWGFPPEPPNIGNAALWDPAKGYGPTAFEDVPPPVVDPDGGGPQSPGIAPIYCSGQSLLPNGEVLVTGGNLVFPGLTDPAYPDWAGLNRAFTFNPWTETWTQQPQMNDGRWYPTQVPLADGRTLVLGGYGATAPGEIFNTDVEIFSPGPAARTAGSFALDAEVALPGALLYPHLFTLPSRDVLMAGPLKHHSGLIDAGQPGDAISWDSFPQSSGSRAGGTAVLQPGSPGGSWKVTQIGGYGYTPPRPDGSRRPTATTEAIDAKNPEAGWKPTASLKISRSYHNTVLLPDKSMVTVGGGLGSTAADGVYAIDSDGARRQVELFDPATRKWRLGPAQLEDRGYHATALLLPDGRVFSGGDNAHPFEPGGGRSLTDNGEIYSPPYLFKGPRPAIKRIPRRVGWRKPLRISTKGRSQARSAVMIAPAATTHGTDMNQRLVPLKIKRLRGREGLDVVSPPNAGVAPPGHYMLFVLNKRGVPSISRWIRLGAE